jgi:hypothetical protein
MTSTGPTDPAAQLWEARYLDLQRDITRCSARGAARIRSDNVSVASGED